ncbi:MAG: hypothetical protein OEW12_08155, partial [Deltaproteobacteria bacterium]|nr:hypothetical protein [Deltaproteobacteria bacterium]
KSHPDLPRRWVAAMAVGMGERTQKYTLGPDESPLRRMALTGALLALLKGRRLPEGPLAAWVTLWGEFFFQRRQTWIARHLPLRHLTYGLDKDSLARLLHDQPTRRVAVMLCGADYRTLDQIRRAATPAYGLRLLEEVAAQRPKTNAWAAQEAQLDFYQSCHAGMIQGRYMVRETVALRLGELLESLRADMEAEHH